MFHGSIGEPDAGRFRPARTTLIDGGFERLASRGGRSAEAEVEFDDFFRRYHRELGRLAYSMTGNHADADDVVGEGLAIAWEHWERVQGADHPRAYVRRIIVNLAANRVNQVVKQRQTVTLLGPIVRRFHPGQDVGAAIDLQAAILALPPGRRACVVLRYVLDLPEIETARTLGISIGTVKSQTSKGLAQLRLALGDGPAAADDHAVRPGGPTMPGTHPQTWRGGDGSGR